MISELGVQFLAWLFLALLFVAVVFLLYQIGMVSVVAWVTYCAIAITAPIFVASSMRIAAGWEKGETSRTA